MNLVMEADVTPLGNRICKMVDVYLKELKNKCSV